MKVNKEDMWAAIDRECAQGKEEEKETGQEKAEEKEQSED